MPLTVLSVAYSMAPVSRNTAGGAEQILAALDHALVAGGHRSVVIAREDSHISGKLIGLPVPAGQLDADKQREMHRRQRAAIQETLARCPVDLIHMHGIDFHAYLPPPGPPTLITLHMPPNWYPRQALFPSRPDTWFNTVSHDQHLHCPKSRTLLGPIENGVPVDALQASCPKQEFLLSLGRICPEKGQHLAIEASRMAGVPLVIAGEVFPYERHQTYLEEQILPRLDEQRRYIGPADFLRKTLLLTAARCLLLTSLVPETSSLVAREALACGTPVIAFDRGALPEAIEHGRTGFLVSDVDDMASAIQHVGMIDPAVCCQAARDHFSEDIMSARYLEIYHRLCGRSGGDRA
ncbi:glycosyltransferase [Microvirga subterranea]|uniref:Glycosyltransferase involved in cell wall biosynthesis n=1 Tax=Microvirga subterranea TaxID=186651 RepID=A0A370HNA7_9HYPH|nr:glycosyltransferase [Microvirga subterranea]RDI60019.1 glycosyltransferase involved in cell wall biosynthesis [Microvirga subterranea]